MTPQAKVEAVRVSKTSFKAWALYGPIDQALKTTCQAEAVRVVNLHLDDVHGEPVDLEMWFNVEPHESREDEPNPLAQTVLQQAEMRKAGVTEIDVVFGGAGLPAIPVVKGIAVLTGPGGTDMPEDHKPCIVAALMGGHVIEN